LYTHASLLASNITIGAHSPAHFPFPGNINDDAAYVTESARRVFFSGLGNTF
jgi:hypothetical protein